MKIIRIPFILAAAFAIAGDNNFIVDAGWELPAQFGSLLCLSYLAYALVARGGAADLLRAAYLYIPAFLYFAYVQFALVFILPFNMEGIATRAQYSIIALLTLFIVPVFLMSRPLERVWFLRFICYCSLALAATGILGAIVSPGSLGAFFSVKSYYRMFGFHASGGILGHMLTLSVQLMLGIFLFRWLKETGAVKGKVWLLLGGGLMVTGLIMTLGRSGWIGVAVGVLIGSAVRNRMQLTVLRAVAMLSVTGLVFLLLYQIGQNVTWVSNFLRLEAGLSNRQYMWDISLEIIRDHPMGLGYRAPQMELAYAFSGDLAARHGIGGAGNHNTFLDVAMSYGIPAAFAYYSIYFAAIINTMRAKIDLPLKRLLLSASVGSLVACHFITFDLGGARFTTLCISILLGMGLVSPCFPMKRFPPERVDI